MNKPTAMQRLLLAMAAISGPIIMPRSRPDAEPLTEFTPPARPAEPSVAHFGVLPRAARPKRRPLKERKERNRRRKQGRPDR